MGMPDDILRRPEAWSMRPFLPLVRPGEPSRRHGFLHEGDGAKVYCRPVMEDKPFDQLPCYDYPDFEALAREGWVPDETGGETAGVGPHGPLHVVEPGE